MSYFKCDACETEDFTPANPFVEVRVPRPSDPTDLCCIIAGCAACFPGTRTPAEWDEYFESGEAGRDGYMWMT